MTIIDICIGVLAGSIVWDTVTKWIKGARNAKRLKATEVRLAKIE